MLAGRKLTFNTEEDFFEFYNNAYAFRKDLVSGRTGSGTSLAPRSDMEEICVLL